VFALVGVIAFVNLGLWQVRRLDERREANALVSARLAESERPLAEVLAEVGDDPDELAYRRVSVDGTYLTDQELLLSVRPHGGSPGHHLLTPLETAGGEGVLVDRGWVPLPLDDPPVSQAAPGEGPVTVRGVLFPPLEDPGSPPDAEFVRQVDLARIAGRTSIELAPVYLLAQEQVPPAPGDLPRPGDLPELDEGPHLSYAIQWFLFAAIVVVGYPLLLRRTAREQASGPARSDRPELAQAAR
jgi:surfeit locus 1 family protein